MTSSTQNPDEKKKVIRTVAITGWEMMMGLQSSKSQKDMLGGMLGP